MERSLPAIVALSALLLSASCSRAPQADLTGDWRLTRIVGGDLHERAPSLGSDALLSIKPNQDVVLSGGLVALQPPQGRIVSQRAGGTPQSSARPAILFERTLPLGGGSEWTVTQAADTLTLGPVG